MNFLQCHSNQYKTGRTQKIQFIVIHFTSNNGDTAKGNASYFSRKQERKASAHYFVDEKEVWQSVKDNDTAYHCGATSYKHPSCRNSNAIGIEMCSRIDSNGKYYIKEETVQNTVNLTKELMKKYGIPTSNILRHYDVTGKSCPEPFVRNSAQWQRFKKLLTETEGIEMEKKQTIILNGKEKICNVIVKDNFTYFKIRDLADEKLMVDYQNGKVIFKVK